MDIDTAEALVLERIRPEAVLELLVDLIGFESVGGSEGPIQIYVSTFLKKIGAEVDVWEIDLDALRTHPAFGMEVERDAAIGVVGVYGDGTGPSLVLNGHVDVVPAGEHERWKHPPWEGTLDDGRVYGRGSCDMKGGLSAILCALSAVEESGVKLNGRVIVESVIGEEDGGVGTLAAVERGYRADGAVIAEPTNLTIAPACAGALTFRVRVKGLSAHGALREEGVSAIEKFQPIHSALQELERSRNDRARISLFERYRLPFAISVGKVHSGDWASSVPEELTFEGRFGIAPGEVVEVAKAEFESAISNASADDPWLRNHPVSVEWWGGQLEPASISVTHPLVEVISKASVEAGGPKKIEGMPYGSDQRLLVNEGGTPAVLFGPGDVRLAHGPDEFVPIEDVLLCSRAIALTILRWCGH